MEIKVNAYFSDYFHVSEAQLSAYGAFDVSLISDMPLFIDPFLLFNSKNETYQLLHDNIIKYLLFLKKMSLSGQLTPHLIDAWYRFPEIKQNWLGFSMAGNYGRGLGRDFALSLDRNLIKIGDYGEETITRSSHLEKLCLLKDGVGKDNVSDFTANLIKEFLLEYTQTFAQANIDSKLRKNITIPRVRFNYNTHSWESIIYDLPYYNGDYVLLTPKNILTKDNTWINRDDMIENFYSIPEAMPNGQLRDQINHYFLSLLPQKAKSADRRKAAEKTVEKFPESIDYFIKLKEQNGDRAVDVSSIKVNYSENLYVNQFKSLIQKLANETGFYKIPGNTYEESMARVEFLKDIIENKDGYRFFYDNNGQPIQREADIHMLYRLTWFATLSDINQEVNNGRGPVDFKASRGSADKSLTEFKLASNSQLKRNLQNQVKIYEKANDTNKSIKVIVYFTAAELKTVSRILRELKLEADKTIVLIDARKDNKPSASKA